jgi:hypothetical protein
LAGIVCLSTFGPGVAYAQYAYEPDALMPPRAVIWRLNDRGFTEISRPRFDGRAYVVEASGPYGDRVRLFVDARDGAILDRQRLGAASAPPPIRVVRPAPGYGWTEDDETPRRRLREAEGMVPPADIPAMPGMPQRRSRIETVVPPSVRTEGADRNPLGMNPEPKGRQDAPRKVVRLNPPAKPAAPRPASDSPKLADTPPAVPKPEAAPATAGLEAPQSAPNPTPAAIQPPAQPVAQSPAQPPAPEKTASKDWKDPPADQKRAVRVIGGATVVPGTTAKDEPAKD